MIRLRWWFAVVVGLIVILPFSWLLSHAALLPFLLGLFFFVLFGLLVGAVMHRIASPGRPYRSRSLVVGTTFVVMAGLSVSIAQEAWDCPAKMAQLASTRTRNLGGRTGTEFRADVESKVRSFLLERYPPGGTLGYVRWMLSGGVLTKDDIADIPRKLVRPQGGTTWAIRVVLSAALLGFGVGSQTFLLKLDRDPVIRAMDRKAPSDAEKARQISSDTLYG